ncbi:mitochondrial S-adenosylmethionine carrier protein-like [Dysidea avara]|uniref:mitochondrial S-adenosylmethionine carrier protein-like n=1 Tax=Dysidea avara TaxID=196820 RepID=UPI003333AC69
MSVKSDFILPLLSGAAAGTTVDLTLHPIDTLKTRLQSSAGFWKSGGFRGVYSGILPAAAGSAPSAATFFCTYEVTKKFLINRTPGYMTPVVFMVAASVGEVTTALVRVPFEMVKQRAQANLHLTPYKILRQILQTQGFRGLYQGYFNHISREIPFSLLQFPLWEGFKQLWSYHQGSAVDPWQGAICGAAAGGIAAAATTPFDVAKTRVMLAMKNSAELKFNMWQLLVQIFRQEGFRGLFAGIVPRVTAISMGGFVFFGAYDKSKKLLSPYLVN